jgi:nucleoside-diphosphate-sugar epimerase
MIDTDVSILGCGWLGRALGQHLVEHDVRVRGSTTTPEKVEALQRDGIEPYLLTLDPGLSGDDVTSFFASPVLVLNVPPPRGHDDVRSRHLRQIDAVRSAAADGAVRWVLFASSTSVYPNVEQRVTEADVPPGEPAALSGPRRSTGRVLLEAEARLMDDSAFDTTIVRFGGLYGDDRHPGRFLAGRSDVGRPEAPVNLIHQDDCVSLLRTLIEQDCRDDVFNACADAHPTRREVYTRAAKVLGLEPPSFDDTDATTGMTVDNQKVKDQCGYRFRHPDPLADLEASGT